MLGAKGGGRTRSRAGSGACQGRWRAASGWRTSRVPSPRRGGTRPSACTPAGAWGTALPGCSTRGTCPPATAWPPLSPAPPPRACGQRGSQGSRGEAGCLGSKVGAPCSACLCAPHRRTRAAQATAHGFGVALYQGAWGACAAGYTAARCGPRAELAGEHGLAKARGRVRGLPTAPSHEPRLCVQGAAGGGDGGDKGLGPQHSTTPHNTAQHRTAQFNTAQHSTCGSVRGAGRRLPRGRAAP